MKRRITALPCLLVAVLAANLLCTGCAADATEYTASTFAMSTLVTQHAYGPNAQEAMREVNAALAEWEEQFSLYAGGDIVRVNAAAGGEAVEVRPGTARLLEQALALGAQSEGAFAVTVAPLTLAWGVSSETPRVPARRELDALLPLVDDAAVRVDGNRVSLPTAGMGLDLGGIAKGAFSTVAREIYEAKGVESAWLSIGGNIYARGAKLDGTPFRMGFSDPNAENAAIASFELCDAVVAVSGGYERFFEADGERYIHIFDPRTGEPAQSDIVSVGVIHEDGAVADFWSTTLFVWGRERALEHMRAGGVVILLDETGTLYVSAALREHFEVYDPEVYAVVYVEASP